MDPLEPIATCIGSNHAQMRYSATELEMIGEDFWQPLLAENVQLDLTIAA